MVKFNLSLHRPRIFENMKIYLQLNTDTKVKILKITFWVLIMILEFKSENQMIKSGFPSA